MSHRPGRSTLAIHGPPHRGGDGEPAVMPIYQSSTFRMGSGGEVVYSRYGNNPNQVEVARRYAALEGAERAVFLSSGNAATALAHLAVLRPGDHLLASEWIYGGTRALFDQEFVRQGIAVSYVNPDQPREWRRSIRKTTRAIFVEAVSNPLLRVVDLDAVAKVTRD
ncbi:MAG TPA: PLP-dependent transferase, partial [Gemmatimonadales bacterium]|nr:PLP-dependent transferase [Gemmatimonadales bacterium]